MVVASARTFGYVWKRVLGFHSVPVCEWISTKFDMGGPLADVINCDDFFVDRFRGIDFVGGFAYHIGIEGRR